MKIYKNDKDQLVIDGDGITTIEVPENIRGVRGLNEWLGSRFVYSGNKPLIDKSMEGKTMWEGKVIITGCTFKWPKISDSELGRFKSVNEIDGSIDLTTKTEFITK